MSLGLPLLAVVTLASQVPDPSPPPPTSVAATRASQPPVIDGRDDDPVWREARPITEFQEWRPSEGAPPKLRSEEHTSELQSQSNLVCRLLLEKKKKKNRNSTTE